MPQIYSAKLLLLTNRPEGKVVKTLLIEEGCDIDHEYYAGIVLDRATGLVTFMGSSEGGVEIEKVAEETPDKIIKVAIDPASGFTPFSEESLPMEWEFLLSKLKAQ